jgi:hypothetical protein
MGKRDFSRREAKKPKKGIKKTQTGAYEPQENVEVIKKGKKEHFEPEE